MGGRGFKKRIVTRNRARQDPEKARRRADGGGSRRARGSRPRDAVVRGVQRASRVQTRPARVQQRRAGEPDSGGGKTRRVGSNPAALAVFPARLVVFPRVTSSAREPPDESPPNALVERYEPTPRAGSNRRRRDGARDATDGCAPPRGSARRRRKQLVPARATTSHFFLRSATKRMNRVDDDCISTTYGYIDTNTESRHHARRGRRARARASRPLPTSPPHPRGSLVRVG